MSLSLIQTQAYDLAMNIRSSDKKAIHIGGYAGTGKTTVMAEIAKEYGKRCAVLAPTNKAAENLRKRGIHTAQTIHSYLYMPGEVEIIKKDKHGETIWHLKDDGDFLLDEAGGKIPVLIRKDMAFSLADKPDCEEVTPNIALVDESSMIDESIYLDILNAFDYCIFFGDPYQLPPVRGKDIFKLVEVDIFFNEIHRNAADSPIIRYATALRQGNDLMPHEIECDEIKFLPYKDPGIRQWSAARDAQIICGRNKTRHAINDVVRRYNGLEQFTLNIGEPVVSLKNYRQFKKLVFYNGQILIAAKDYEKTDDHLYSEFVKLKKNAEEADGAHFLFPFWNEGYFALYDNRPAWENEKQRRKSPDNKVRDIRYGAEFDYAYCLTVHKAQGSEFPAVVVFDERDMWRDNYETAQRWLYTAVTRAKEELLLVQK